MKIPILGLLIVIWITGCAQVPETKITFPTKFGTFMLNSPKENSWTNVSLEISPDGTVKAKIGAVTSHNNAEVIGTVVNANAAMVDSQTQLLKGLVESYVNSKNPLR